MLEQANAIIGEYQADGFSLTLRQLYYQFVSRGLLENNLRNYKKLGDTISKGRRAGVISWEAIVDRTRFLRRGNTWASPAEIVEASANQYRRDLWEDQSSYVEIWFEKDALLGVFERAAEEFRLPIFSCRGYASDSEIWAAAQRLVAKRRQGKAVTILHFGDHDPSGIDMTRDIDARLDLFGEGAFEVRRLALTIAQVKKYNPPPNPAKETDSRFDDYKEKYGVESWELDALEPKLLAKIVRSNVLPLLNQSIWQESKDQEQTERDQLQTVSIKWDEVVEFAEKNE